MPKEMRHTVSSTLKQCLFAKIEDKKSLVNTLDEIPGLKNILICFFDIKAHDARDETVSGQERQDQSGGDDMALV